MRFRRSGETQIRANRDGWLRVTSRGLVGKPARCSGDNQRYGKERVPGRLRTRSFTSHFMWETTITILTYSRTAGRVRDRGTSWIEDRSMGLEDRIGDGWFRPRRVRR